MCERLTHVVNTAPQIPSELTCGAHLGGQATASAGGGHDTQCANLFVTYFIYFYTALQIPSELVERIWEAKRLPLLVEDTMRTVNANMMTQEARFLTQMKDEKEVFAHDIEAVTMRAMVSV